MESSIYNLVYTVNLIKLFLINLNICSKVMLYLITRRFIFYIFELKILKKLIKNLKPNI